MCTCEELNKLKFYVRVTEGKHFEFVDDPSFLLSGCSATVHLLDHRYFHVLDVVVVGQIKVLGHGKNSIIARIMIRILHRPKVLTKTVHKFMAGFSNVQHVTLLAKDRIDHTGGSKIEQPFEVNTCALGSYCISLCHVVTGVTPESVAWKWSWWCLVLVSAGGKGTMDQDVKETSFLPIDAQGLDAKYACSGWVFSQNAEICQEDFPNFLVTGMEIKHQGQFSRSLDTVFSGTCAKSSLLAYSLSSRPT